MKKEIRGFIAGILVAGVVAGSIGTASAVVGRVQANLDYNNIKISLNGQTVTPKDANGNTVEPFAINGTTYLPVRAVGDALGLDVNWDGNTKTVYLEGSTEDDLTPVQLMGFYKILGDSFDELVNQAEDLRTGLMKDMVNMPIEDKNSDYYGMTFRDVIKGNLSDDLELVEGHYESCRPFLTDDDIALMSSYRQLKQRIVGYIDSAADGASVELPAIVLFDCELGAAKADIGFWNVYQAAFD